MLENDERICSRLVAVARGEVVFVPVSALNEKL